MIAVANIAVAKSRPLEKKSWYSWNSAPVPDLRATTRQHGNHRAMQDPIGQWYASGIRHLVGAMRNR